MLPTTTRYADMLKEMLDLNTKVTKDPIEAKMGLGGSSQRMEAIHQAGQ